MIRNKKLLTAAMTAAFCLSGGSWAANSVAETGTVFGAQVGYGFLNSAPDGSGFDNSHIAWGGSMGYQFDLGDGLYAGAEAAYNYGGQIKFGGKPPLSAFKVDLYDLSVMGTLGYVVMLGGMDVNLIAKAGMSHARDIGFADNSGNLSVDDTKWLPKVSVGVGYAVMDDLTLTLSYDYLFGSQKKDYQNLLSSPDKHVNVKPVANGRVMLGLSYLIPSK